MATDQNLFDFAAPRLGERSVLEVDLVSFDFETTGLDPFRDRIIEAGAVLWRKAAAVERLHSMVNAGVTVSARSTAVHGIYSEDLIGAPDEKEVIRRLLAFMEGRIAVAHNLPFDYGFLESAVQRNGFAMPDIIFLDSLTFSRKVFPGLPGYSLGKMIDYFGISQETAHRADSDAYDCGRLFFKCLEDDLHAGSMSIDELVLYSRSRTSKR
jgi:DNA polymerase-3 subunit epsilon/DNA polymerase-3 subunit alpha (Gram-positive type)